MEAAGIDARDRLCNFFHRRVQTPRNDGQGKAEALEAFGSFMLCIRLISMRIVGTELSSFHADAEANSVPLEALATALVLRVRNQVVRS